ncbi:hypothetical protein DFR29_120119 [Tahibacter aquaticus]|uniref:Uncharacterized protein n=1 Tax=Tahibacter aquaticus TaxID=520092 RepID=A0A4R6YMH4_9GAMM|nr:hypothetical protein [Tahibacter aquaticus]TDR38618.1 hypothetical protein DFR29_120119 [Tahibacter aquaticus]
MSLKPDGYPASTLTFSLSGTAVRIELPVAMPPSMLSAFERQIARQREQDAGGLWTGFSRALREAVIRVLDDDLKEPSDVQLREAARLARAHGLDLPHDAMCYRGALRQFVASLKSADTA